MIWKQRNGIIMQFNGEYWITATGETIKAPGNGGHTGVIHHCLIVDSNDERKKAMEEAGWKRIDGLNIETWFLTESDCDAIKYGLINAYGENVMYQCVNVYVYSTNKWYVQLPLDELKPSTKVEHYAER